MRRYAIRDDQWNRIKDTLPGREGSVGVTAVTTACSSRRCSTAIAPVSPGVTCRSAVVTGRMSIAASPAGPTRVCGRPSSSGSPPTPLMSTRRSTAPSRAPTNTAPAPKKAGEAQAVGRSRGGLSTKIHALVDALGNPIGFHLTGGEAHDPGEPTTCFQGSRRAS